MTGNQQRVIEGMHVVIGMRFSGVRIYEDGGGFSTESPDSELGYPETFRIVPDEKTSIRLYIESRVHATYPGEESGKKDM
jgi:hypothetical protein